jgi:anti-sigma B factor antagonist/stage II sporulation protein AA (anti-sigma F factor antagonist)
LSTTDPVQLVESGSFLVARLDGEIDASNAREIQAALIDALPNSAYGLVMDLSEVYFIDSTGVRFLFDLATRLDRRQQEVRLVVAKGSNVHRTLSLVQMGAAVRMFEDVEDATSEDCTSSLQ